MIFHGRAPPPLTPPHTGEGELPRAKSPSPVWGGVRGWGAQRFAFCAFGADTGTA